MVIDVTVGDVLFCDADVLISTANPWLNMSGGVNGAILSAGGDSIQQELKAHLKELGKSAVPAGTVVTTSSGALGFQRIVHAVAIDPFYDSSVELVAMTLESALKVAVDSGVKSVATPALATGYGPLTMGQFAQALVQTRAVFSDEPLRLRVVVRSETDAGEIEGVLKTDEA